MPIKQLTPKEEIEGFLEEQVSRLRQAILRNLAYVGEQCLNVARRTKSYKDQTGNLRSSIGYVIVENGRIIKASDFALSDKGTDRITGQKEGKEYAKKLATLFPSGLTLLMVAGMNYAAYVSAKGYDVLDSSELKADLLTEKLLRKLGLK